MGRNNLNPWTSSNNFRQIIENPLTPQFTDTRGSAGAFCTEFPPEHVASYGEVHTYTYPRGQGKYNPGYRKVYAGTH